MAVLLGLMLAVGAYCDDPPTFSITPDGTTYKAVGTQVALVVVVSIMVLALSGTRLAHAAEGGAEGLDVTINGEDGTIYKAVGDSVTLQVSCDCSGDHDQGDVTMEGWHPESGTSIESAFDYLDNPVCTACDDNGFTVTGDAKTQIVETVSGACSVHNNSDSETLVIFDVDIDDPTSFPAYVALGTELSLGCTVTPAAAQGGTYTWSKASGPGNVTFDTASSEDPTFSADEAGEYTVEVRYTKGGSTAEDTSGTIVVGGVNVTSIAPTTNLTLGSDLTVNYEIVPAGYNFDSAELRVYNKSDVLVCKVTGIEATSGTHSTTWEDAKWNQNPYPGAYANPNNSDYKIKVVGIENGFECESDEETINTVFVIEADIKDEKAGGASAAAGLADLGSALEVIVKQGETSYNLSAGTLTDMTDGKHVKVDSATLNTLADGTWTVQLKDVRDDIGNFYDSNPNTSDIDHYEWKVELR